MAQQCWYSWCGRVEDEKIVLCPHEDALKGPRATENPRQDIIEEWDIDVSERETVLGDLFQMNITPFSLFRSVDSAIETAALRLFKSV